MNDFNSSSTKIAMLAKNKKKLVLCLAIVGLLATLNSLKPLGDGQSVADHSDFDFMVRKFCPATQLSVDVQSCLANVARFDNQSENDCGQCLGLKTVFHHTFWQATGGREHLQLRVMKLNMASFLTTQNLCCTKFIFWKLGDLTPALEADLRSSFKRFVDLDLIRIENVDLRDLCSGSGSNPFVHHAICSSSLSSISQAAQDAGQVASVSDIIRFLVLFKYGGIYTDGDVIYLKSMRQLWTKNFAYRWSHLNALNTAVLGINKRSLLTGFMKHLVSADLQSVSSLSRRLHPLALSTFIGKFTKSSEICSNPLLSVYHSFLFDPAWLCNDNYIRRDSFKPEWPCEFRQLVSKAVTHKGQDFFRGSFTYHMHFGHFNMEPAEHSMMRHLEEHYQSRLEKLVP